MRKSRSCASSACISVSSGPAFLGCDCPSIRSPPPSLSSCSSAHSSCLKPVRISLYMLLSRRQSNSKFFVEGCSRFLCRHASTRGSEPAHRAGQRGRRVHEDGNPLPAVVRYVAPVGIGTGTSQADKTERDLMLDTSTQLANTFRGMNSKTVASPFASRFPSRI